MSNVAIETKITQGLAGFPYDGKKILIIVPDLTRTLPLPWLFRILAAQLRGRAARFDFLIALGTHPPLSDGQIDQLFGFAPGERARDFADIQFYNHDWKNPQALRSLGTIPADEIFALSQGLLRVEVPVRINSLIFDYDELLVVGPVFPHEVVGFSGGTKYFFPGIAGQDIIDITHWIGALVTSYALIGTKDTPVRAVIDRAAGMIQLPKRAICAVVDQAHIEDVFVGPVQEAWNAAADLAARSHITWLDRPYKTVLSILPAMYDEIWVGAKGMYKLEPVVADGGEIIIYAPHVHRLSEVHGELIKRIGYHCRDYFVKQWDKFQAFPWGVLAHSTHLKGTGSYDAATGTETARIKVTLACSISAAECRAVNLGWRDWRDIDLNEWRDKAMSDNDIFVVERAGEQLYRLKADRP